MDNGKILLRFDSGAGPGLLFSPSPPTPPSAAGPLAPSQRRRGAAAADRAGGVPQEAAGRVQVPPSRLSSSLAQGRASSPPHKKYVFSLVCELFWPTFFPPDGLSPASDERYLEAARAEGLIRSYGLATWDCLRVPPSDPVHLPLSEVIKLAEMAAAGKFHGLRFVQLPVGGR